MRQKSCFIIYISGILCILLNCAGKAVAEGFTLPLWMDSFGTVLMAYLYGPVCGIMVGVCGNILCSIFLDVSILYGFTSIAIGMIVGVCARKGYMHSIFGVLSTAFLTTISSVGISVPLNYYLHKGSVGNVWGNSVSKYLQEMGFISVLSNIVGQFYIDFLDKVITILLLFALLCIVHRVRKQKNRSFDYRKAGNLLLLLCIPAMLFSAVPATAGEDNQKQTSQFSDYNSYIQTVFDGKNGLPGGMANDIEQTRDGVLWLGTYNGLYRYNGNTFQWMDKMEAVKSVNCLYTDEAGRMWIGTNDSGLAICTNQEIVNVINNDNGLPADSVRCITESSEGFYYIGTTDCLAVLTLSNGLKVCDTVPEIMYAKSICADKNGNVATVSDEGILYLLRGTEIVSEMKTEAGYTC